jgi:hypothetical protein
MPEFGALLKEELCGTCVRLVRAVLVLLLDLALAALVIGIAKVVGELVALLFHESADAEALRSIDFAGKLGALCVLALLLVWDIARQLLRRTSPPC